MKSYLYLAITALLIISCAKEEEIIIKESNAFTITTSPAENCSNAMNFSWATDSTIKSAILQVTTANDTKWKRAISKTYNGVFCTTYDSIYSKNSAGENFYEDVKIYKYNATIENLTPDTKYKYRIIAKDTSSTHYFKTANIDEWSACIISDFHVYSPIYKRTAAAMEMISTMEQKMPFNFILHLGDITAWGGSYSFWRGLYKEMPFHKYMWAGVNGNHDNMTRTYEGSCNRFFRDAAAYPTNGYGDEIGVCYYFYYGEALFIMLNNESMRSDEGLIEAQKWVKEVIANNPAPYTIVCEHYQWFFGKNGESSQYHRWSNLFDSLGVNLALGANNHIYVSTHPLYNQEVTNSPKGTLYIQTPSSDNERGVEYDKTLPLEFNPDKIKLRWSEGANTVGALHISTNRERMVIKLIDREGNIIDESTVYPRR